MELSEMKFDDVKYYFDVAVSRAAFWERKWRDSSELPDKLEAFLCWDGALRRKAEIKAELVRRDAGAYDWTAPKPPRRLP